MTFNMVGGGGGKLKNTDAVLIVTVPTGSTVTATKSGVTLTPTMWVKAADASLDCAIFSIPASQFDSTTPWTITATLGTNTASTTILIVSNKEYEVELSYRFYLFKSESGPLIKLRTATADGSYKWDITNERMYVQGNDGWGGRGVQSRDEIDLTNYTQLVVDGYYSSPGGGSPRSASFITHTQIKSTGEDQTASGENRVAPINLPSRRGIIRIDVSSYNTAYYVTIGGCWTMYIYNWWLE